jgi:mannan endo-1,4-beta-mannosidase
MRKIQPKLPSKTNEYIDEHIKVAQNLKKPLVLEEFGFPREKESLDKKASVENRDHYYEFVFEKMKTSIKAGLPFTALNFWGYGGLGKNNPENGKWNLETIIPQTHHKNRKD